MFDVPVIGGSICISPQECNGSYVFDPIGIKTVMTKGFINLFKSQTLASLIVAQSCVMIHQAFKKPDYLQSFVYENELKGISEVYWAIHDEEYITFLLPDEY